MGVWWPLRLMERGTSGNEDSYGLQSWGHGGLGLFGGVPGHACSSTRSELAAVILSMTSSVPIHVGLNNLAVVKRGTQ